MSTSRTAKRDQLIRLLHAGDFQAVADLSASGGVVTLLLQLLFEPESLLHWRAIEAIGHIAKVQPKKIKNIIPRLLWSLNEDSASFGWGAAAVLGEIGKNNYALVEDIILMLFQFLEEDFTREGILWGLGRLGQTHSEVVKEIAPRLQACLADSNPQSRAYAAWSLGIIGTLAAIPDLQRLIEDSHQIRLYEDGVLREVTLGQIAAEALERLATLTPADN